MLREFNYTLGAIPDYPDARDYVKAVSLKTQIRAEDGFEDLTADKVINQGSIGCCAGCAAAQAIYLLTKKIGMAFLPSPLYVYYKTREKMGTVHQDSGSQLRYVMKTLTEGVPVNDAWPSLSAWEIPPPYDVVARASFQIKGYERIPIDMEAANAVAKVLQEEGLPVLVGTKVYHDMTLEAGRTGIMTRPDTDNDKLAGGHCMLITAFRQNSEDITGLEFRVLNSWGANWGEHGYCWLSGEYIADNTLTFDLWTFSREYW